MKKLLFSFVLLAWAWAIEAQVPAVKLTSTEGQTVDVRSYAAAEDGPVIVSFFATWCKPCLRELKAIAEEYDEWQERTGVRLIAVSIDAAQDAQKVKALADANGWEWLTLLDTEGELKRALQVQTVPHTFVFDRHGNKKMTQQGYSDGEEERILKLLEGL